MVQWEVVMKDNQKSNCRILKVEEIGDFWRGDTIPRIRLKGKWLDNAGFPPNTRVEVNNTQHGVLLISIVEEE